MEISIKINDAVKYFGTKAKVARELGIIRQSVNSWSLDGNTYVPEPSASRLCLLTRGKLKGCPDLT